jgi:hypothetical protein
VKLDHARSEGAVMRVLRVSLVLTALVAAASLAGCGGAVQKEDDKALEASLEEENGGFGEQDESPDFGEPPEESPFAQPLPTLSAEPDDKADGVRRFRVALIWGHLPPARDASEDDLEPRWVDWTGSVSTDGAIGQVRTLKFDGRDRITGRGAGSVSFVSHTNPHIDGLYLHVIVKSGASPVLHFDTASLKTDIDLNGLGTKLGGVARVDDRNGLAWVGYEEKAGCDRGLLFGKWNKRRPHLARIKGHIVGPSGDPAGRIRGVAGHAPRRGKDVFFGKAINQAGNAIALFGGTYGGGEANGVWISLHPREVGRVQIAYSDGYEKNDGRGVWLGRFSERCTD